MPAAEIPTAEPWRAKIADNAGIFDDLLIIERLGEAFRAAVGIRPQYQARAVVVDAAEGIGKNILADLVVGVAVGGFARGPQSPDGCPQECRQVWRV